MPGYTSCCSRPYSTVKAITDRDPLWLGRICQPSYLSDIIAYLATSENGCPYSLGKFGCTRFLRRFQFLLDAVRFFRIDAAAAPPFRRTRQSGNVRFRFQLHNLLFHPVEAAGSRAALDRMQRADLAPFACGLSPFGRGRQFVAFVAKLVVFFLHFVQLGRQIGHLRARLSVESGQIGRLLIVLDLLLEKLAGKPFVAVTKACSA